MRIGRAVHDHFALVHHLAVVHQHMLVLGNQELVRHAVHVGDHQALLALGVLAERHGAGDFRQHARILGRTRLEQFRHTRQTTGNVAGLGGFLRNARQHLAHADVLPVFHGDDGTDLKGHRNRGIGSRQLDLAAIIIQQTDQRAQALAGSAGTLRIDHHQRGQTGHFVDLLGDGHALFDVLEAHLDRRTR